MDATQVALLTATIGPVLAFAAAWVGFRATAAKQAREQAASAVETYYGRIVADNARLSEENQHHEARVSELIVEVASLNRRVGTYEADLARLTRENESLRAEIERQANLLILESSEKRKLSEHLVNEQREKRELLKRVVKLEATLAGMAGVITTAGEEGDG